MPKTNHYHQHDCRITQKIGNQKNIKNQKVNRTQLNPNLTLQSNQILHC